MTSDPLSAPDNGVLVAPPPDGATVDLPKRGGATASCRTREEDEACIIDVKWRKSSKNILFWLRLSCRPLKGFRKRQITHPLC